MIESFGNRLSRDLFFDRNSRATRNFPSQLRRASRRKLLYLHDAVDLNDLRAPPGNRLKALKDDRRGFYSIRINDQWRVVFRWRNGQASSVQIVDYH
ncbi:MAG: type II toxin-antitoxin system RelE/ParE family toxin [Gammaproteobacteria bacterium]|nr:type II toxin-antitoxin system RelE/ParE family toxin [Gammaproteobacteria bacterium]MCY4166096.1 type II toxin-antitoxin system RelE/ParE family toxin [Gammaproteobacteria bacterium]MCY4256116.1 type II toxin-antitoxin system RelE/ParE family toxin [Gammaproteobacteria bacterium]MCY4340802.1 type II toxin-antitoxin system RelE/ParE family toxin [Gammaproteobacteria bacterium]